MTPEAAAAPAWNWRGVILCATAAMLAGLVYLNALHNPFVYDDHRTILANGSIRHLTDLRAIVMHDATRPLVNLSYAVDRRIWGAEPFGFHLTSVLLHVVNVVLLFLVAWRFAQDRARLGAPRDAPSARPAVVAFGAAALFAVHPMMTEAVGYISGRSEVLCATWFLLAVLCGRRWMLAGGPFWWCGSLLLWGAALATKEVAVTLPAIFWCVDRWLLDGTAVDRRRRFWRLQFPFGALAIAAGLARSLVFLFIEHPHDLAIGWRTAVVEFGVVGRYLALLVVPGGQAIFHDVSSQGALASGTVLGAIAVCLLVAAAWRLRRTEGLTTVGVFWFLLVLAPSSTLVVLGLGEGMAEHRVYLASCGLFLAAGAVMGWLDARLASTRRRIRWLAVTGFAAVLLSFAGRAMLRNSIWASSVDLWTEAADAAPHSAFPQVVLGESLHEEGRHAEAVAAYERALALDPDDELPYMKVGLCLSELGRFDEATARFEALRARHPASTVVSTGLGMVAQLSGNPERARRLFRETIAHDPRDVMARHWLALIEEEADHPAEALRLCEEAQRLVPGDASAEDCVLRNRQRLAAISSGSQ